MSNLFIRTAVWEKNRQGLPPATLASQLVVYQNWDAFAESLPALPPNTRLTADFGTNEDNALWVVVPSPTVQGIYIKWY